MSIGQSYRTNFDTIRRAAENGDLCLLEVYERTTGKPAVMLCAGFTDENDEVNLIPLAQMLEGNPYETHVTEKENVAKYVGNGHAWVKRVSDDELLSLRRPHYPGDWEVARVILEDHLGEVSPLVHHCFLEEMIKPLRGPWSISAPELDSWIAHAREEESEDETASPDQT